MPKQNHCEIIFILDISTSMKEQEEKTVSGFNSFIEEQKAIPGSANVTVVLFSSFDNIKILFERENLYTIRKLEMKDVESNGMTALYDAIGTTIDLLGSKYAELPEEEKPEKVILGVITDGNENNSQKFRQYDIIDKIKHQSDNYNWNFVFLGADVRITQQGTSMGFTSKSYDPNNVATAHVLYSRSVASLRSN